MGRRTALTLFFLALACGPSHTREGPIYAGRSEGEPSMECLPDADVTDEAFTEHMTRGRDLARASFEVPDPDFPTDRTAAALSAYAAGPLRAWIEHKTHAVDSAREELDLAAEENHRQRIMGGAMVGLMHEDIGRIISRMPVPDDLANEPEILAAFEHVIQGQAAPYYRLARQAYRACSLNAVSPASMQHWSHFCRERMDNLPDDGSEDGGPDGTTVEVTHD
jgi:hypothetical protein